MKPEFVTRAESPAHVESLWSLKESIEPGTDRAMKMSPQPVKMI